MRSPFKNLLILASASLTFFSSTCVGAETPPAQFKFTPEWRTFIEFSYVSGGDGTEVLPLFSRATGDIEASGQVKPLQDDISAGGVLKFSGGVEIPLTESFSVSGSIGYMSDDVKGDLTDGSGGRGKIEIKRVTSELITFYSFGEHRIGLGAVFHISPEVVHYESSSSFNLQSTYEFDSAYGGLFQYDYKVSENTSLGLRYSQISYDIVDVKVRYVDGVNDQNRAITCNLGCEELLNADSVDLHISYRF